MGNTFCETCNEILKDENFLGENDSSKKNNPPITNIKNPFFFKNSSNLSLLDHQTNTESLNYNRNKNEKNMNSLNYPLTAEIEQKLIRNGKMSTFNIYKNSSIKNPNKNNANFTNSYYNNYSNKNISEDSKFDENFNININKNFNTLNKTANENYHNHFNNNSKDDNDNDNNANNSIRNINFINNDNNAAASNINININSNFSKENEEKEKENEEEKESLENISARKITNLFRKFYYAKKLSRSKLYIDLSEIPSSEYIIGLNSDKLDIDLAPENKCIYLGTKFKNKKDGLGLELFNNSKAKYFGIFNNGERINAGVFDINNDLKNYTYKGQIKGIYASGYGWFVDRKELKEYEGMWDRSMKNGFGIEKYSDNSEYRGCFLNGKKEGIGIYKWKDNSYYEGEWKENKLSGYGIYQFNDGSIYKGQWKRSKFHGFGIFTDPGIKKYFGFFEKDKRCGFGIEIWMKIEKAFIGFWRDNDIDGFGKFIVNDKIRYGVWKEGILVEQFHNKEYFYKKIQEEQIDFLNFFQIDEYNTILDLIDENL